ncbi:MAG: VanZ family protein [Bacteroidales bacterium]|nr:VanZ family protein [Bacteroidales bacterium]
MKDKTPEYRPITMTRLLPTFLTSFWKTILCTVVIIILSFLPGSSFEKVRFFDFSFQDLFVHFVMYAVFTALIILELSRKPYRLMNSKFWWLFPLLLTAVLGLITESVQRLWIAGRDGNVVDFFFNMCGSALVIVLYRIFYFPYHKQKTN